MARSRIAIVPAHVEQKILLLRGERAMLDADLAALQAPETTEFSVEAPGIEPSTRRGR
jgi:hypothetical protein